jgi:hypothetical protein
MSDSMVCMYVILNNICGCEWILSDSESLNLRHLVNTIWTAPCQTPIILFISFPNMYSVSSTGFHESRCTSTQPNLCSCYVYFLASVIALLVVWLLPWPSKLRYSVSVQADKTKVDRAILNTVEVVPVTDWLHAGYTIMLYFGLHMKSMAFVKGMICPCKNFPNSIAHY